MRKALYVAFIAALTAVVTKAEPMIANTTSDIEPNDLKDITDALRNATALSQELHNETALDVQRTAGAPMLRAAAKGKKHPTQPPTQAGDPVPVGSCAFIDTSKIPADTPQVISFPGGAKIIISTAPVLNPYTKDARFKVIYLRPGEKLNAAYMDWYDIITKKGRALPIKPNSIIRINNNAGKGDLYSRPYDVFCVEEIVPTKQSFQFSPTWSFSSPIITDPNKRAFYVPESILSTRGAKDQQGIDTCPATGYGPGYPHGRLLSSVVEELGEDQVTANVEGSVVSSPLTSTATRLRGA